MTPQGDSTAMPNANMRLIITLLLIANTHTTNQTCRRTLFQRRHHAHMASRCLKIYKLANCSVPLNTAGYLKKCHRSLPQAKQLISCQKLRRRIATSGCALFKCFLLCESLGFSMVRIGVRKRHTFKISVMELHAV